MMNQTQKEMIILKLKKDGYISRNWALRKFCSRLGALMLKLKEQGLVYQGGYVENRDYVYKVKGQKRLLKILLNS